MRVEPCEQFQFAMTDAPSVDLYQFASAQKSISEPNREKDNQPFAFTRATTTQQAAKSSSTIANTLEALYHCDRLVFLLDRVTTTQTTTLPHELAGGKNLLRLLPLVRNSSADY